MEPPNEWHGTAREWDELVSAVEHNCGCDWKSLTYRESVCLAHQQLTEQLALDRLVFARRIAKHLAANEFSVEASGNSQTTIS
jgi:hypothetical protein